MSRTSPDWDAPSYHRLSGPQYGWGLALLERVALRGDETVLDAGCGTGRMTVELLRRLPHGRVIALDRSAAMLDVARVSLRGQPSSRVLLARADLAALPLRAAADMIVSNATFHWVLDAPALYRNLFVALKPGGRLVAQCGGGRNLVLLRERALLMMRSGRYGRDLTDWTESWLFLEPEAAADLLRKAGFVDVKVDLEAAPTRFETRTEYRDYVERVVLAGHIAALPTDEHRARFLEELCDRAAKDNPPYILDYRRLNLEARKEGG
jgi:trans-aconitate methyltransferase